MSTFESLTQGGRGSDQFSTIEAKGKVTLMRGHVRKDRIGPKSLTAVGINIALLYPDEWGRGGLMVSALDSGASGPGSSPGWGQCVVFLGKTLYSHSASLHPGV